MNQYERYLSNRFSVPSVFLLAGQLADELRSRFRISDVNARKVVQRAALKRIMNSSSPLTFGKGQFLYYGGGGTLDRFRIMSAAKLSRPPLYRLLSVMEMQGGIISHFEAMKVASCPVIQGKTKASSLSEVIDPLVELDVISEFRDTKSGLHWVFADMEKEAVSLSLKHRIQTSIDCAFLADVLYWLRNRNLVDGRTPVYRRKSVPWELIVHNDLVWDAFAYTRTTGIDVMRPGRGHTTAKATLVAIDTAVGRPYSEKDLEGFYERIQMIRHSTHEKPRKVMPIVVYATAEPRVMSRTASLGIMNLDLATVFGARIYEIIQKLELLKSEEFSRSDSSETLVAHIGHILSVTKEAGQDTNLQNMRGDLFESLMFPLIRHVYPNGDIQPKKVLRDGAEKYEYDYIVSSSGHRENVVFELKGFRSSSMIKLGTSDKRNTVSWFFGRTLPFARKVLDRTGAGYSLKACYVTTAGFEPDAVKALDAQNRGKLKPADLDVWYDGPHLMKLLRAKGLTHVAKVVKRYYMSKERQLPFSTSTAPAKTAIKPVRNDDGRENAPNRGDGQAD